VIGVLEKLQIDALVAIGGDDTLSYAARLHREGVKVMACPKTMDNDVFGTDYCIGFGTAVGRSVEFIDALRTPTGSHERIAVVELFGRNSGETALISGYLAGADRVLISEVPFDIDKLAALIMADKAANPSNYAVVVVSEGARMIGSEVIEAGEPDPYGHRRLGGIGEVLGKALKQRTGQGIVNQTLAYLMRSGPPVALDRMVASAFGTMAVQSLEAGETGLMMALRDGNYETVPVDTCIQGEKRVDVAELYDPDTYRPIIRRVRGKPMYLY
jgi:6-phosphofructokinase 1